MIQPSLLAHPCDAKYNKLSWPIRSCRQNNEWKPYYQDQSSLSTTWITAINFFGPWVAKIRLRRHLRLRLTVDILNEQPYAQTELSLMFVLLHTSAFSWASIHFLTLGTVQNYWYRGKRFLITSSMQALRRGSNLSAICPSVGPLSHGMHEWYIDICFHQNSESRYEQLRRRLYCRRLP